MHTHTAQGAHSCCCCCGRNSSCCHCRSDHCSLHAPNWSVVHVELIMPFPCACPTPASQRKLLLLIPQGSKSQCHRFCSYFSRHPRTAHPPSSGKESRKRHAHQRSARLPPPTSGKTSWQCPTSAVSPECPELCCFPLSAPLDQSWLRFCSHACRCLLL